MGHQVRSPNGPTLAKCRASMTWAQHLKRVFGIDIETCRACGGAVRNIACIEDPEGIGKILAHLDSKNATAGRRLFEDPGIRDGIGKNSVCFSYS